MSKSADQQIAENITDVMKNGPGLRYDRHTPMLARCPTGTHTLHGGLGAMGCGEMWRRTKESDIDESWAALPEIACCARGMPASYWSGRGLVFSEPCHPPMALAGQDEYIWLEP